AGECPVGTQRLLDPLADLGVGVFHQPRAGAADYLQDIANALHAVDVPDGVLCPGLLVRGADPAVQGDAAVHRIDVDGRLGQALGREQGRLGPGRDPGVGCDRLSCPMPGQRQDRRERGPADASRCAHRTLLPGTGGELIARRRGAVFSAWTPDWVVLTRPGRDYGPGRPSLTSSPPTSGGARTARPARGARRSAPSSGGGGA